MKIHKQPRTISAATEMLERHAELEGKIATISQARDKAIADINAKIDTALLPMITERDQITEKLKPWWMKARDKLLTGKRKSIELGGCMIGSRKGKDTLNYNGDLNEPVEAFAGLRWTKNLIIIIKKVDAVATLKALEGKHSEKLKELGFEQVDGTEAFFIKRTKQGGTLGETSS